MIFFIVKRSWNLTGLSYINFNRTNRNRKLILWIYNKIIIFFLFNFSFWDILIEINFDKRILDKPDSGATFVYVATFTLDSHSIDLFLLYLTSRRYRITWLHWFISYYLRIKSMVFILKTVNYLRFY